MSNRKLYNLCIIPIFSIMTKKIIQTDKAPAPIGPYSQAVMVNNMLYVSGQIAINPANGQLVLDNIIEETQQVMNNLKAILEAADMDFSNVIKTTIFLKDMNQFSSVNEVYGAYFKSDFPARETVQVAALPKFVNVEISVVAAV